MDASSPPAPSARADSTPPAWRLAVLDRCVGSGMCAGIAAGHFRVGEDYRSHPVNAEIAPDEAVADAVASCPMEAIVVTDAATGERLEF